MSLAPCSRIRGDSEHVIGRRARCARGFSQEAGALGQDDTCLADVSSLVLIGPWLAAKALPSHGLMVTCYYSNLR